MDILNFIPLLIWLLTFPIMVTFDWKLGDQKESSDGGDGVAVIYVYGAIFWFAVAVILSISP